MFAVPCPRGVIEDIQATHPSVAARLAVLVDGSTAQHRRALEILARCLDSVSLNTNRHYDFRPLVRSEWPVDHDETQELSNVSLECRASPVLLGSTLVADW